MVHNMEDSLDFYTNFIGLDIVNDINVSPTCRVVFLGKGETKIELVYEERNKHIENSSFISWGFEVPSLDETMSLLQDKGIEIIEGPTKPNPFVRFIFIKDPNGMRIQLIENIK